MAGIFEKFKKKSESKNTRHYIRYLICGSDIYALKALEILKSKYGESEVLLLSDKKISKDDFSFLGPSTLRSEKNIEALKNYFPAFHLEKSSQSNLFLKEGEWKNFGGRTKGEVLLEGENFFVNERAILGMNDFLSFKESENLKIKERVPVRILKREPSDLVERSNYTVECIGGDIYECEYLIWAYQPDRFEKILETKSFFSKSFLECLTNLKSHCALYVRVQTQESFCHLKETLFIPLSYTYEWGHFIGEFTNENTRGDFIHYLDKDQMNEEEVAKRIRHLKKTFEKLFPTYDEKKVKYFISLSENVPQFKDEQLTWEFEKNDLEKLTFVGEQAPQEMMSTKGFTHALFSLEKLKDL